MQLTLDLRVTPGDAISSSALKQQIAVAAGKDIKEVNGYNIIRRSLDARSRQPHVQLRVIAFLNEPFQPIKPEAVSFPDVSHAKKTAVVIGAGPAGLFAALKLLELGIKPIIIERGKDVRARRRDLAQLNRSGIVNPESNYCFGEGGAGTYSDGKLYTRSTKRGDIYRILNLLVQFGASPDILIDAHPHIGTNKLPQIIVAMRNELIAHGAVVLFEKKLSRLNIENGEIVGVYTDDGDFINTESVILATGHSARDIFQLLQEQKILVQVKPFALGVRIEHPQSVIDSVQYHNPNRNPLLPPASYSLVTQIAERGVFSFCMCPGGIIAPAATNAGEIVVNGWSPSKRDNPFANSGMVVQVEEKDMKAYKKHEALAGMFFQQDVEQRAFFTGGGNLVAPAQRLVDFTEKKTSSSLPVCSYLPGITSIPMHEVLPPFIFDSLQKALPVFGKKMKGYFTNDAVVVATESRTSSPVRIPRDAEKLHHPQIQNLFPCGEGAGYAGGIVSAAMDGERVAEQAARQMR